MSCLNVYCNTFQLYPFVFWYFSLVHLHLINIGKNILHIRTLRETSGMAKLASQVSPCRASSVRQNLRCSGLSDVAIPGTCIIVQGNYCLHVSRRLPETQAVPTTYTALQMINL